jgi:chaperone BCS1
MSFDSLYAAFANNQLLVGGIGTVAFGSVMYVLRALPEKLLDLIERTVWTKAHVESMSNEYRDVDAFIESRRLAFFSRSVEIKDGTLKTGFGGGWGTYGGKLLKYSKTRTTQQIAPFETIAVSFLTRDRAIVERFMKDATPEELKNSIHVSLFSAGGNAGGLRRRKRGLNTVFVDRRIKERLVERLTWFLGAEEWHTKRGIPWKLGIILHGPPGTGKTSLIHALASDFDFHIKYIKSLHGLGGAFLTGKHNDLFVIEDIDTIASNLNRDSAHIETQSAKPDKSGADSALLHEILNAMDGMQPPDGLKFIVTTNHIARLDSAIVRPGRIDEVIEIGPLSLESAREMFKAFYGRDGMTAYSPQTGARLQQMFSTMNADAAETELAQLAEGR